MSRKKFTLTEDNFLLYLFNFFALLIVEERINIEAPFFTFVTFVIDVIRALKMLLIQ